MFESIKIHRLISQIVGSPDQDNAGLVRSLRSFGKAGLAPLVEAFRNNKINYPNFEKYLHAYYDREQMEHYIVLMADPKEQVRSVAREVLEQKAGTAAVPRLVERLREGNPMLRRGIIDLLKKVAGPSTLDKLVPILRDGDKEVKGLLIGVIADVCGPQGVPYLLPMLSSPDWWVRKKAVEAVCHMKDLSLVEPLVAQLSGERDPKIKITIIQALGQARSPVAARAVLRHIADDDLVVRQGVVEALETCADASMVPEIIASMKDADVNVRRAGVEVLSRLKSVDSAETLIGCMQDSDWWVREIAIDALALVKDASATGRVKALFAHPDENVRRAAVEYFNRMPNAEVFEPLLAMLKDSDWWVREKAVAALGKLRDARAIDPIMELQNDYDVRWVVPEALGDIGGPAAMEHLCDFMDDPERNVRLSALRALGKVKDKNTLPLIKSAVKDADNEIRDLALKIIKEMTGHAVKANQVIAEQEREKWTGGSTIFTTPFADGARVRTEAILVLDLANSTDIGSKFGDDFAFKLTNRLVEETRPLASRHRARFTKSTGDGYLMTFKEIGQALHFAVDILETLRKSNAEHPPQERIDVRIAINAGETRVDDKGDRLGTAVNMTFRVEGVKPKDLIQENGGMKPEEMPLLNRILVTEAVREEIVKQSLAATRAVGLFELKGITGKHRIFLVQPS